MPRKIGIIGVGHVGAHCAFSLCLQGICDELLLVDIDEQKAKSEAIDLSDCCKYLPHRVRILTGSCSDVAECDIVVISVGVHKKSVGPHEMAGAEDIQQRSRLHGLQMKLGIMDDFIPQILAAGFRGIFIVISNPCDIVAYHIWKTTGYDRSKIFATGTMLDSARFCRILSGATGYDPKSIVGFTMGEHGDSQIAVWSHVSLGGKPLEQLETKLDKEAIIQEVRRTAWNIADGKGATEYGISTVLSKIVNAIYHDEKAVFPLSTLIQGQYGMKDLFISTPCILGRNGIEQVMELDLPENELRGFRNSCQTIKSYLQ